MAEGFRILISVCNLLATNFPYYLLMLPSNEFQVTSQADVFDQTALSRFIKDQARKLGFDKAAIVRADSLKEEGARLREWLDRGYQGQMHWMSRNVEKRLDPTRILDGAQSVVVVALNYFTPEQHSTVEGAGKISRYAWGEDYHDVLSTKLRQLLSAIREIKADVAGKVCVDIQPTMDKAWAVRAGLGWLGKHSNVITTDLGSWVFIGELMLNLELEYDTTQVDDHCGTCTLCIDECPTQAITEPYVVDSNKCLSYATIELRSSELPNAISEKLSGWLYGCDICQDVCPWNRHEQIANENRFRPREGNLAPSLQSILELTPESYAQRYRGSAMKRAKLAGLKRNARTLLTNRGKTR